MSNRSQFNSRYWNYRFNNNCYFTVNYYYNNYYVTIHYYNDYYYYEILRMLLKLLVRIFISILKLRWNSNALREPEYEGELSLPFPRTLPISLT